MSVFGLVPPEVPVIRSPAGLEPGFRARVRVLLAKLAAEGFDPIIAESLRSDERQRYLFGFGRDYDDGRGIVTNASTGHLSWHFYGLAVDIISRTQLWNAPPAFWSALAEYVHTLGLAWGGDWPTFPDKPHVQSGPPMPTSPSPQTFAIYQSGGVQAVWRELSVAEPPARG